MNRTLSSHEPWGAALPPLSARRGDLVFFVVSLLFALTSFVPDSAGALGIDLVHMDKTRAAPPLWPPLCILEALSWYGRRFDLLMLHGPLYFRAMMWGDVLFTGPFYLFAAYAFLRGRDWIRVPAFVYASHVLSYAVILTAENLAGPYASPAPAVLFAFYTPYWIFGVALMIRLRRHRPFTSRYSIHRAAPDAIVTRVPQAQRSCPAVLLLPDTLPPRAFRPECAGPGALRARRCSARRRSPGSRRCWPPRSRAGTRPGPAPPRGP